MFSILVLVGSLCAMIGAILYKLFLRTSDTRFVCFIGSLFKILGAFGTYVQAKRWNLEIGISDLAYLFITDVVFSVIGVMLFGLPLMALITKLIPRRIEGSTFALLTTCDALGM